jgi:hypothetical protein
MIVARGVGLACVGLAIASAQTLPRPAAPFEFTLLDSKAASHLADYKNRIIVLYLFSPN